MAIKKTLFSVLQELAEIKTFLIIWLGQFGSLIGSGMTAFALDIWVYQRTGSVTQYALIALFNVIPPILVSPVAGAFVDRWDRRSTILISDFIAALVTIFIALLFFSENLHFWQIAIATSVISITNVFQKLALSTTTKLLVAEKHLNFAVGLSQIGEAIGSLFVPALAGTLVLSIQMQGILMIDFATYLFSLLTLLFIRIPSLPYGNEAFLEVENQAKVPANLYSDVLYGWRYTISRPDILSLIIYFTVINFLIGMVSLLLVPMVLGFLSTSDAGVMLSVGGIGSLFGSVFLSIFGGSKYRVTKTMFFGLCLGICIVLVGLRPSSVLIMSAVFGGMLFFSLINGISEVLLISSIPVEVQGRVFGLQTMIISSSIPLAYLIVGPLTDMVFEPLLATNGFLASSIGKVIGVGSGRGIALLFIILGIMQIIATIFAYSNRSLRKLDCPIPLTSSTT
jgi:MFS transporter, DHA3 family, macrolide efflux protein